LICGVEGTIYRKGDMHTISSVKAKMRCVQGEIRGPTETLSDNQGRFQLKGRGVPLDCIMEFEHPDYTSESIRLDQNERLEPKDGFGWVWQLRVELEPKTEK